MRSGPPELARHVFAYERCACSPAHYAEHWRCVVVCRTALTGGASDHDAGYCVVYDGAHTRMCVRVARPLAPAPWLCVSFTASRPREGRTTDRNRDVRELVQGPAP